MDCFGFLVHHYFTAVISISLIYLFHFPYISPPCHLLQTCVLLFLSIPHNFQGNIKHREVRTQKK